MEKVTVSVKWRLLSRPDTEKDYAIAAGTRVADFLPQILDGIATDEVLVIFNGQPKTLQDRIEQNGNLELIPMLCGG